MQQLFSKGALSSTAGTHLTEQINFPGHGVAIHSSSRPIAKAAVHETVGEHTKNKRDSAYAQLVERRRLNASVPGASSAPAASAKPRVKVSAGRKILGRMLPH